MWWCSINNCRVICLYKCHSGSWWFSGFITAVSHVQTSRHGAWWHDQDWYLDNNCNQWTKRMKWFCINWHHKKIPLARTEDGKILKASPKVCLSHYDLKRERAGVEPPCFRLLLSKHTQRSQEQHVSQPGRKGQVEEPLKSHNELHRQRRSVML